MIRMERAAVTQVVLPIIFGIVAVLVCAAVFAYLHSRHRVLTAGVRSTGRVIDVQPISFLQRHSVIEKPTENITVVTAAAPRGVRVDQKVPAGQYRVGQEVPVLHAQGNPYKVLLDRPDLERPAIVVYSPLLMAAVIPFIVIAAITGPR